MVYGIHLIVSGGMGALSITSPNIAIVPLSTHAPTSTAWEAWTAMDRSGSYLTSALSPGRRSKGPTCVPPKPGSLGSRQDTDETRATAHAETQRLQSIQLPRRSSAP